MPESAILRAVLSVVALGMIIAGWHYADRLLEIALYLWHQVVVPAFHSLLISGLALCS